MPTRRPSQGAADAGAYAGSESLLVEMLQPQRFQQASSGCFRRSCTSGGKFAAAAMDSRSSPGGLIACSSRIDTWPSVVRRPRRRRTRRRVSVLDPTQRCVNPTQLVLTQRLHEPSIARQTLCMRVPHMQELARYLRRDAGRALDPVKVGRGKWRLWGAARRVPGGGTCRQSGACCWRGHRTLRPASALLRRQLRRRHSPILCGGALAQSGACWRDRRTL